MGFFTEIQNFIKTEVIGIEETTAAKEKSAVKKPVIPIIECKTEAPEDKFEKKADTTTQQNIQNTGMSLGAMKETIAKIPSSNINLNNMLQPKSLEYITGLSENDFDKLSPKEKNAIIEAIKYVASDSKESYGIMPDIMVLERAKNIYEALRQGDFKDIKEFRNEVGDIAEDLGSDFDTRTDEEKQKSLKQCRIKQNNKIKAEIENTKNLPEKERKAEEARIRRKRRFIEREQFFKIIIKKDYKTSANAVILLHSDDMSYGAKTLLKTRKNEEERKRIADYADYNHTKKLLKTYCEIGDTPKAESLKEYTSTYMAAKSSEAAYEYQANYKSDRDMFETAVQKLDNGEALTAEEQELLSIMNNEYYTAAARGIGEGALNNVNMSTSEKAEFINKWEADAKCYNDYKEVTQDVKKAVSEKPEYKEIKEEIKEKEQNKKENSAAASSNTVNTAKKSEQKPNQNAYSRLKPTIPANPAATSPVQRKSTGHATIPQEFKKQNTEEKPVKNFNEAIQEYGHKAVVAILEDNSLVHLRPQLKGVIKSYDLNTLQEIALKCSDSSFVYICTLINDENRSKLIDFREKTKGLCYSAKEQIKNLRGEDAIV